MFYFLAIGAIGVSLQADIVTFVDPQIVTVTKTESRQLVVDQVVTTTVIDNPGLAYAEMEKNQKNIGFGISFVYSDAIKLWSLPVSYRINDQFGIRGSLPLLNNSETSKTGIGDISIGFDYFSSIFGSEKQITEFRYKSTTGSADDGLGSGNDSFGLSQTMTGLNLYDINWFGTIGYSFNSSGQYRDYSYGDIMLISVGATMNYVYYISTRLNYFSAATDQYAGSEIGNEYSTTDLFIDVSNMRFSDIPLTVGIKIPIATENADKTFQIYANISSF
jgi:hypothetical protein